VYTGMKIKQRK